MGTQFEEMRQRLHHIGNLSNYIEELFTKLPGNLISEKQRKKMMQIMMDDDELQNLLDGLKNPRPPRFVLVGRTGVGKSSLINAISGHYLAEVSEIEIGTTEAKRYAYEADGHVYFEVIDTRGIGESESFDTKAEEALKEVIQSFEPDAVLFLQKAAERAHIDKDVEITKKIMKKAAEGLPLIAVITQVDELNPSRVKEPEKYPTEKLRLIEDKITQLKRIFDQHDLKASAFLPVSSYIEWSEDEEGSPSIEFDGRFGIEDLIDFLEDSLDIRAAIHLGLSVRLNSISERIALRFIKVFTALAGTVALSPLIATDIAVLLALQSILLMIIAYLSGRELDFKTAREVLVSLGGIGATGFTLRMIAQQGSKFANLVIPGAGSAISASIASGGTYAIGKAAIAYFLRGADESDLKAIAKNARVEYEKDLDSKKG
ncbi:GTPase [Sporosarcina aquimarina]|uniref:50S ribosome-binding GTPase n=1 Tax=Sporosarcina aquimarina TaxID=114975 RepID=A0ABU4FZT8_9BACL|nr:GTPase [Sporosarcina aquimarina]MDW0110233.1 50S ribosome-binding GTPase [Sporosarcina aquimarina]